jgi:hypothetical protein
MMIAAIAVGAVLGLALVESTSCNQQRAAPAPSVHGRPEAQDGMVPAWTPVPYVLPDATTTNQLSTLDAEGR